MAWLITQEFMTIVGFFICGTTSGTSGRRPSRVNGVHRVTVPRQYQVHEGPAVPHLEFSEGHHAG